MRRTALIAAGGAAGSLVRAGVSFAPIPAALPVATLVVNLVGAFALGVLVARTPAGPEGEARRALIGVGFLGALTTFSAFALQLVRLPWPVAGVYVVLTLAGGLGLASLGLRAGARP